MQVHHTVEHTFTWANANNKRFFFNAGGKVRFLFTRNGGGLADGSSASSKDGSVDELITAIGNLDMGSAQTVRSGSGETLTTNGLGNGASDLTGTLYQSYQIDTGKRYIHFNDYGSTSKM